MRTRAFLIALAAIAALDLNSPMAHAAVSLTPIGTHSSGALFDGDKGAAEIPAYDWLTRRLFVVNAIEQQIDVLDLSNPSAPTKLFDIDVSALGTPNSVDTRLGLVAVAIEAPVKSDPGTVAFYRPNGKFVSAVQVGALPDMLTFSPDGLLLVVANEGEPEGSVDPEGSVSIIDRRRGPSHATVRTAGFTAFDRQSLDPSIIIAAGKLPSIDLEPEFITVSRSGQTAWMTLQEANAVAEVDLKSASVTALRGLGFKDHGVARNSLDTSDRDNAINLCSWTNLFGMYQPDAIASFQAKGKTYLVTANEGDSRDADESRVSALTLDPLAFPGATLWKQNPNLGRLTVNKTLGLIAGKYQKLFVYGARSFSIWTTAGQQVFDSGNDLERITSAFGPAPAPPLLQGPPVPLAPPATCPRTAAASPAPPTTTPFNSNSEESPSFDTRSDNKGRSRKASPWASTSVGPTPSSDSSGSAGSSSTTSRTRSRPSSRPTSTRAISRRPTRFRTSSVTSPAQEPLPPKASPSCPPQSELAGAADRLERGARDDDRLSAERVPILRTAAAFDGRRRTSEHRSNRERAGAARACALASRAARSMLAA